MKRRLKVFKTKNNAHPNSLWHWEKAQNPLKIYFNFIITALAKYTPSLRVKNALYRLLGMKIGNHASIAAGVTVDFIFPELIEIGDNAVIGYGTLLTAHEFLVSEYRKGKIKIGKNVLIGANSTILPGVEIGNNATISACSLVNADIPPNAFVGGVPAKPIKKRKLKN
ncbi:MAG: acyltransferase [Candidatus Micrarchaeia archaeon]